MQIVCTPLHLLALDTYNTPTASLSERAANVGRLLPDSTGIRMFRFLCAYGIGGVLYRDRVCSFAAFLMIHSVQAQIIY
jgi:hypothetical protein